MSRITFSRSNWVLSLLLFVSGRFCFAGDERIAAVHATDTAVSVVAVLDPHLDLATRLVQERKEVDRSMGFGPSIVVGQGAHASNHTYVRVLDENGLAKVQFLSYPQEIRGGVRVAAGCDGEGLAFVATAPISDASVYALRIFDAYGGPRAEIALARALRAPFVIAVGDFLKDHKGDEVAIATSEQGRQMGTGVLFYSPNGAYLDVIRFKSPESGQVRLEAARLEGRSHLELFYPESGHLLEFDPVGGEHQFRQFDLDQPVDGMFRSAFSPNQHIATLEGAELSEAIVYEGLAAVERQNLGRHENEFWITNSKFGIKDSEDGEYIKFARYGHVRTDGSSPAYQNANIFLSESSDSWAAGVRPASNGLGQLKKPLDEIKRVLWEPCFTHRQFNDRFDAWKSVLDEATQLPKYLSLSRENNISYYGEFGKTNSFVGSTYAFGLPALDRLYLKPLRAFLVRLNESFREHPERILSLEPNHEHEIAVKEDKSVGDYNPAMIRGFREYLKNHYGADISVALAARKGPSVEKFDAPRDQGRGSWDAYDFDNHFFDDWVYFNRYVVNRRLADTYTQALMAGFPPELVKSHQIPDSYAVGTLDLFSERIRRITPIDYAMTAGVGFGLTRFTVWYNKPSYAFKAAYSSGFDSITFGEYQALTSDQNLANEQLKYIWDHGANAVHAMVWPESHDRGFNDTMRSAIEYMLERHDEPRMGVTGGVGAVRPYVAEGERYNVVSIGTSATHRGLIKSLKADGSWQGAVYTVPFRRQITIDALDAQLVGSSIEVEPVDLEAGQQLVIRFTVESGVDSTLRFTPKHESGGMLPGFDRAVPVASGSREYQVTLRAQLPVQGFVPMLTFENSRIRVADLTARLENEEVARTHRGDHEGVPHRGGVTFDLLP